MGRGWVCACASACVCRDPKVSSTTTKASLEIDLEETHGDYASAHGAGQTLKAFATKGVRDKRAPREALIVWHPNSVVWYTQSLPPVSIPPEPPSMKVMFFSLRRVPSNKDLQSLVNFRYPEYSTAQSSCPPRRMSLAHQDIENF